MNEHVTHVTNIFIKSEYILHYYKMVCDICNMLNVVCIPYSGACDMFVTCRDMLQYGQKLLIFN